MDNTPTIEEGVVANRQEIPARKKLLLSGIP